ncbi:MAG: serine hydrolase domain-containing protein [Phycisphaeraceae bacterium]
MTALRRLPVCSMLFLLLLAVGCSSASPRVEAIHESMDAFVKQHKAAGIVTLVMKDGKVIHQDAVGQADIEANKPMAADSLFWIASMTKPITGAAVAILEDEGKLKTSDPVSKYIPAFKDVKLNGAPPSREITLRDLMTHSSGIGEARGSQSVAGSTLEEIANAIAAQPMKYEPGTKWSYGSGNTVVGRVIEVVSGMPYDEFLRTRIVEPLKMKDTTFNLSAAQLARVARSYQSNKAKDGLERVENKYVIEEPGARQTSNPSGGLFSTAGDLARFYQMVLNGGELDGKRILSKDAVKNMTSMLLDESIETGFTPGNSWGYGFCVVRNPQGVTAMLSPGSCGHGGAHGTQSWCDPTKQMVFIMLVQRTGFGNGDASEIRQALQALAVKHVDK